MKFAPQAAMATANVSSATQPAVDRVRQRFTALRHAVAARFARASAAFHERYAFETSAPGVIAAGHPRSVLMVGYLFPHGGGKLLPLFEGNFAVTADPNGQPALKFPLPGQSASGWLRQERDFVEVVETDGKPARRFHANDSLVLGSQRYVLKIVDPACRVPCTVEVDAEGAFR